MDLDLNSPESKKIVADFLALGADRNKQIAMFHDPAKNPVLGRIFATVHFPKPAEPASETQQP